MQPQLTTNHHPSIPHPAPSRGRRLALMFGLFAAGSAGAVAFMHLVPVKLPAVLASISTSTAEAAPDRAKPNWIAAAPGRVEPRSGQVRIASLAPGRIIDVTAALGDRVTKGDMLIRLDDREARARLATAEAEVAIRLRERDAQPETAGREEVRKAEDALYAAERLVANSRFALDGVLAADRKLAGNPQELLKARNQLVQAEDKLRQERSALAAAHSRTKVTAPNRLEVALIAARAELTLAEERVEMMRIRAPVTASVLQIQAKLGELAMPTAEQVLVVLGDLSIMRVRAEVDEQDVPKIKTGQQVFVRSGAYPGREFSGIVKELAPSLALPRMGSRGARRALDVEVMEVLVDLEGTTPLLSGMRADVYFR